MQKRRRPYRSLLHLERLEDRTVPAFTGTVSGNFAFWDGTAGIDTLTIDASGGLLRHDDSSGNFASEFDFDSTVAGVQSLPIASVPRLTVNGGNGSDLFNVGTSAVPASSFQCRLIFNGDGGTDFLNWNNLSDTVDRQINVQGGIFNQVFIPFTGASVAFGLNNMIEGFSILAGTGNDTINISESPLNLGTINGNGGNDTFNIGDGGIMNGLGGFTLEGSDGNDVVNFDDQNETSGQSYTLTNNSLARSNAGTTTFQLFETVNLLAGSGADVVNIHQTLSTVTTNINTGVGIDFVNGGNAGSMQSILGAVNLTDPSGSDQLAFNNVNDTIGRSLAVSTAGVTGLAPGVISFIDSGGQMNISNGSGDDTVTIVDDLNMILGISGSNGVDTLVAPNLNNTWDINTNNAGIQGVINSASGYERLIGGSQSDTFNFGTVFDPKILINGAAGTDTFNYTAHTTSGIAVNLGLGTTGLSATLNSDAEVPPQGSAATGTVSITNYNIATKTFDINLNVSDLDPASVTGFHLHGGAMGINDAVLIDFLSLGSLTPNGTGFTYSATGVSLPAVQEAAFLAGLTYINIHTSAFPNGIIRGQVLSSGNVNLANGTASGVTQVTGIEHMTGSTGNDSLVGSFAANTMLGGDGNDILLGGPGADTMRGGVNDDIIVWSNGDGSDVIEGDAGLDLVQVNGSLTADDQFVIGPNGLRLAFQRTSPGPFTLDIGTTEGLNVLGNGGNDNFNTVNLTGVADLTTLNLFGLEGNDTFNNLAPATSAAINIDGGPGSNGAGVNSVTFDLTGTTNPTQASTTATSGLTTYGNRSPVSYRNIQNLTSISGAFQPSNPGPSNLALFIGANFDENSNSGLLGSFDNPDGEAHTVTIDFGDGSVPLVLNLPAGVHGFQVDHFYFDDNPSGTLADIHTVTVTVTDGVNTLTGTRNTLIHNVAPSNANVTATPTSAGSASTITVTFDDPGTLDPHLLNVDFGDGQTQNIGVGPGQSSVTFTHTYTNPGNFTVSVVVNDDDLGSSPQVQTTVNVANPVPIVTPPVPPTSIEGASTQFLLGAFTDPNNSGNYTVTVNWGDSSPNTVFNQANTGAVTFQNHTFSQDGVFTVTITVADVDGSSTPVSFLATVSNVLPVAIDSPDQFAVATIAQSFDLGSFSDPGADAPWTVTVNWGDGSPNGNFTVNTPGVLPTLTHAFATAGTFNVVVTVNDDDGFGTSDYLVTVIPPEAHVLGNVFRDFNRDGSFNTTDRGQSGVVVFADRDGDGILDANEPTATTDLDGNYNLTVGFEGAVHVRQVVPEGFTQTTGDPTTVNVNFGDTVSVDAMGLGRIVKPIVAVAGRTGNQPFVQVRDVDGTLRFSFTPYATVKTALKDVRLATGDVNDDGIEDIFAVPGPGIAGAISIFSGADGQLLRVFSAFSFPYTKGLSVAAGDVNGDGVADVWVGTDPGAGPVVRVFDGATTNLLKSFTPVNATQASGVRVAAGDVNGDGVVDVITTPGLGNTTNRIRVMAYDALSGSILQNYVVAKPGSNAAQIGITAGDLDGDGRAETLINFTKNGRSELLTFSNGASTSTATWKGSAVQVAAKDLNGDGIADLLFAGSAGQLPRIALKDGSSGLTLLNALILSSTQKKGLVIA